MAIVTFDQIIESRRKICLDSALKVLFPQASEFVKEGLIGLGFGTVEVDGVGWDWILKADHYVFFLAE